MRNFTLCRFRLTVFTALFVTAFLLATVCGCAICKKFTKSVSATPPPAVADDTTALPSTDTVVRGSDAVTPSTTTTTTEVAKPVIVSETISNVVVDDTALRAAKTRIDELERKVVSLEGEVVGRDITIRSLKQTAETLTVAKPVTLPTPTIPVSGVDVKNVDGVVRVVVPSAMIFEDGSLDKIKPSGEDVLLKVVTELETKFPNKTIAVEGYTDSMSLDSNDPAQLLNLSGYQARVVVNHLTNATRVNPERLKIVGCGASSPIADNATEEGRAKNRRVEFVVGE